MKRRVLHIISGLQVGGAEMMLYKLLSSLQTQKVEHSVVSMLKGGAIAEKIKSLDINVTHLGMKPGQINLAAYYRLRSAVQVFSPQIIQGWMYHGNIAAWITAKSLNPRPKLLWNIRQSEYDLSTEKRLTRLLIRLGAKVSDKVDGIIYNSNTSQLQHEALGYSSKYATLISNGFDLDVFRSNDVARCEVRYDLGISDDILLIGMIGRYDSMKDHGNFLKAAKIVKRQFEGVRFLLAGPRVEKLNSDLFSMIEAHGLQDVTYLLGERSDIPRLNAALDIAVLSSHSEGFPNVIGEAMACGVPCVVTDVGDSARVVGDTGMVVPPRDSNALAGAIIELKDSSADERRVIGQRARQRVVDHFALETIAKQYDRLYSEYY